MGLSVQRPANRAAHRAAHRRAFGARSELPPAPPAPGAVTSLRVQPRHPGRYIVTLSGADVGPVSAACIGALGLRVGTVVSAEGVEALLSAARRIECLDRGLAALARRARSADELRRWLRQRDYESAHVEDAIERLIAAGALDDLAFARGFAHSRLVGRGFGPRRVASELGRRGVASATISLVLAEQREESDGDEQGRLEEVARRRLRSLGGLEPEVARRRLIGWLVRRGFGAGEAATVVRALVPRRAQDR